MHTGHGVFGGLLRRDGEAEIATYDEVLELLTAQARNGSVTAAVALERLRNGPPESIDDAIDRILAESEERSDGPTAEPEGL